MVYDLMKTDHFKINQISCHIVYVLICFSKSVTRFMYFPDFELHVLFDWKTCGLQLTFLISNTRYLKQMSGLLGKQLSRTNTRYLELSIRELWFSDPLENQLQYLEPSKRSENCSSYRGFKMRSSCLP